MTAETDLHEAEAPEEDVLVEEPEAAAPEPKPEPAKPKKPRFDNLDESDGEYGVKVQKRLSKEVGRRYAAEQQAAAAQARADALERANAELRKTYLSSADAAIERDIQGARGRHQRAFSEGDAEAATQAAVELAELAARRAEVQRDVRNVPQPQQRQQQTQFTPKTQGFINERPFLMSDPDAGETARAADKAAVRRGMVVESPEYFEFIDKRLRAVHPEHYSDDEDGDDEDEAPAPRRSAAPPVAPARRTVPGQQVKPKLPSLTAAEADMARSMGIPLNDYAVEKAKLLAAGKLGTGR